MGSAMFHTRGTGSLGMAWFSVSGLMSIADCLSGDTSDSSDVVGPTSG